MRDFTDSFDIPFVNNFCLKLSMPGVAYLCFPLKDGVLWSDLSRSLGFRAKVTGFVLIVLVNESTRILFAILELLPPVMPDLSKLWLIPDLLERTGGENIFLCGNMTSKKHPPFLEWV